jgi:chemotaxis protein methyltransferase WspC
MLTTTPFEALLAARIGLDPASIGHDEVERAVKTRMRARGLADPARYLEALQASEDEVDDLVELVLMKVTWFFRESGAFALVAARAAEAAAKGPPGVFRVLSLPCATGEEPYSIAMALLAAGVPADRIRIDGVDISRHALEVAQRGVYDARAVRFTESGILGRYFVESGREYRVIDEVKRLVTLARGNLVSPGLLAGRGPYDVVFCRNVLIYIGEPARERVLQTIDRLLGPGGLLLTGHAEGQRLVAPRFVSAGVPGAFAFARATHADRTPVARTPRVIPRPARSGPAAAAGTGPRHPVGDPRDVARARARERARAHDEVPAATDHASLARITADADAGRLVEARRACLAFLDTHPESAEGHYLLGVIELESGRRRDAEAAFRRAVYLDPDHGDALLHLALVRARQGDGQEAEQFRRRATRARKPAPDT